VHPLGRLHPQIQRVLDLDAAGPPHPFWKIYMNEEVPKLWTPES
jgi:hypothetical protein